MSDLTIGRLSFDYVKSLPSDAGNLNGTYEVASLTEAEVMRQNVVNMIGTVQPVTWASYPGFDGFYRVKKAGVKWPRASLTYEWDLALEPLPHHRALEIEATCAGADRANAYSSGTPWYAIPSGAVAVNYGTGGINTDTRTGARGSVFLMTGTGFYDRYARWTCAPGDYYDVAPRIQFAGIDVVGNQSTQSPEDVTLDNGFLKIALGSTTTFSVTPPNSGSTDWGTAYGLDVGEWDGVSVLAPLQASTAYAFRVTRECPEVVAGRFSFYQLGLIRHVDVALRRGAVIAEIVISQESAYTNEQWGIQQTACQTTLGAGTRALRSATINGHRRAIFSDVATTQDTASGLMYASAAADQWLGGVGVVLNGTSASAESTDVKMRDQWFAGQQITERFSGVRQ